MDFVYERVIQKIREVINILTNVISNIIVEYYDVQNRSNKCNDICLSDQHDISYLHNKRAK